MSAITYNTKNQNQNTVNENNNANIQNLKGINNGTWGFGMIGAFFPENMNGPLGYLYNPIPNDNQNHALLNGPQYNSKDGNYPAYNADHFKSLSGYDTGFSMSGPNSVFTSKCKKV